MRTWVYSIAYIPCLSVSCRYNNQFSEKIVNTYNVDANKYALASLSGYEQNIIILRTINALSCSVGLCLPLIKTVAY